MNIDTTSAARPADLLSSIFGRVETMLSPEAEGAFSANEAPLTAAVRAVAKLFGAKPAPGIGPGRDESQGESLERIARSAGLIARETVLMPNWRNAVAVPMIVRRKSDGAPLAVMPRGQRWYVVDGSAPRRPQRLSDEAANGLETQAHILSPALPDKAITWKELALYGLRSKAGDLAVYAVMSLLAGLALACVPMANGAVTNIVIPGRDLALLQHIFAMLVALMLASLATRLSAALCELRINGRTGSMLRAAAADRTIRVLRDESKAALSPAAAALITRSVETWHRTVWHLGLGVVAGLLVALPSLAVMTRTSPLSALLLLSIIVAAVAMSALIAKRQVDNLFSGPCSPTSWISMSYEALSQIITVRSFGAEARFFKMFSESFLSLKDRFLASDRLGARIYAIEATLEMVLVATAVAVVVILNRGMSADDSVQFSMAVMTVAGAAVTMVHGFTQASMIGLQHRMIQPILQAVPAPAAEGANPGKLEGAITLSEVVVRHANAARPTLSGVSLTIEPGQQIGIVGPSGSGKSTLLKTILGLSAVESGYVSIDGMDLAQLDAAAVRRQIGVVGQAGKLFPGTIEDNIAAGVAITQEQAWEALRLAALDADVAAMPLGMSTPIGDADPVLSTGQVQRLMLARAVVQRPRILILDEATSALDPATEERVAAAVASLEATVIIVAHRLDTIRHCDCIHVLDGGQIVQSGSFDELAGTEGLFAELVEAELRASVDPGEYRRNEALWQQDLLEKEFNQ